MKIHFVTFGDGSEPRRAAAKRLAAQASEAGWFESSTPLHVVDLPRLSLEWFLSNQNFLASTPRGLGCWIWKPFIILESLRNLRPDELLVYADAGHEISSAGAERFRHYVELASEHQLLCFEIAEKVRKWTKGDLLHYWGIQNRTDILDANQLQAGLLFIRRTTANMLLISQWAETCVARNYSLVNDAPSSHPNPTGFQEHRHDQSVLTLLLRMTKHGTWMPDEAYHPELIKNGAFIPSVPFHCLRNHTGVRFIPPNQLHRTPIPVE
jgi:hypothetical protein